MKMEKSCKNSIRRNFYASVVSQIAIAIALSLSLAGNLAAQERTAHVTGDDSVKKARDLFAQGVKLYSSGRFERALEAFQQAYDLRPNAIVRVNIANCHERMGRPVEAISNFERFLAETDGQSRQQQAVESAIKRLRGKLSELTIQVVPDGASVQIDSIQRKRAPIVEPIALSAGKHVIEVTHSDYPPERREIELQSGRPMEISIILRRQKPTAAPFETPVAPPPQGRPAIPQELKAKAIKKEPSREPSGKDKSLELAKSL
jgi:tetratricopeptide (TPR) repeat protein